MDEKQRKKDKKKDKKRKSDAAADPESVKAAVAASPAVNGLAAAEGDYVPPINFKAMLPQKASALPRELLGAANQPPSDRYELWLMRMPRDLEAKQLDGLSMSVLKTSDGTQSDALSARLTVADSTYSVASEGGDFESSQVLNLLAGKGGGGVLRPGVPFSRMVTASKVITVPEISKEKVYVPREKVPIRAKTELTFRVKLPGEKLTTSAALLALAASGKGGGKGKDEKVKSRKSSGAKDDSGAAGATSKVSRKSEGVKKKDVPKTPKTAKKDRKSSK